MLSQQKGHDGRRMDGRMDSSVLLPPITPQSIISTADWSSLAELSAASVCPACCLSLYTPKGGGLWHTHNTPTRTQTHTDTHTHTHTHFSSSPSLSTHTATCAPVLLTSSMQQKQIRHPCIHAGLCSSGSQIYGVCAAWHTRGDKLHSRSLQSRHTLLHTHTHSLKTEFTGEGKNRSLKEWIILKRLLPEEERNTWKEHVHFMLWIRERKGSETLQPSGVVFFFLFNPLSFCGHEEGVCVSKQTDAKKKKKKPSSGVFWRLCAKVSVRSGARTVPYASDGSNPSPVQHRSGGNERERGEHRRWRRWRRERRGRRSGGQRCCGPV